MQLTEERKNLVVISERNIGTFIRPLSLYGDKRYNSKAVQ
jgi:hypothetical protein